MRLRTAGITVVLAAMIGCGNKDSNGPPDDELAATAVSEDAPAPAVAAATTQTGDGFSGQHRENPENMWVPAEYQQGNSRFKDPCVYVDGVPTGMLRFGELPVPLEPYWHEERASVAFTANSTGPRYEIVKQRRYRWVDYFKAIGLDVNRIKQVHIYGGAKRRAAVVITGKELRSNDGFMFRFGSEVYGKTIPACPDGIGDGKCPDIIGAVAVYIDKKAPVRKGADFFLDGEKLKDIPYYGEPLRGGVRVYRDGALAATIKRRLLTDEALKVTSPEGNTQWKFFGFLESQGVKTDDIVEAWVIQRNLRVKRLTRDQIVDATFEASGQKSGQILLGSESIPANAIALHTEALSDEDLPVLQPHEIEDE